MISGKAKFTRSYGPLYPLASGRITSSARKRLASEENAMRNSVRVNSYDHRVEPPIKQPKPEPEPPVERSELPPGMVRLRHPDGSGCGWRGIAYPADPDDGTVIVPVEAMEELASHLFEPVALSE